MNPFTAQKKWAFGVRWGGVGEDYMWGYCIGVGWCGWGWSGVGWVGPSGFGWGQVPGSCVVEHGAPPFNQRTGLQIPLCNPKKKKNLIRSYAELITKLPRLLQATGYFPGVFPL
jgi:hypothetical protein